MKKLILLFAVFVMIANSFAQSYQNPLDLEGNWRRDDGLKIYISMYESGNGYATVKSVGNSPIPAKAIGGENFKQIRYEDGNWKATNYNWYFTNNNPENGYWKNRGEVIISLAKDKKSFEVEGLIYYKSY